MERQPHHSLANLITSFASSACARSPSVVPRGLYEHFPRVHTYTRTYTYECVPPTRLTRPCRTTTVSKIEFATSEVCLHHWFPPSFENGIVHEYPSKRWPLNENWPKGERTSFEWFFARSIINCISVARGEFRKNRRMGGFGWKNFVAFRRWIFYLSIDFNLKYLGLFYFW